jgi:biotin carboxyl carrier protein
MSKLLVTVNGHPFEVEIALTQECAQGCTAVVNGRTLQITLPAADQALEPGWMIINERPYELTFDDNLHWVRAYSGLHRLEIQDQEARVVRPRSGDGRVKAPIPGLVTRVLVSPGQQVQANQPLIVLEAMKMENEIRAPFDGTVTSVSVSPGDSVVRSAVLAEIS